MINISKRLNTLHEKIAEASHLAGRDPSDISLLAVSKQQEKIAISEATEAGQKHFGENYLQEALPKVAAFPEVDWHFIGAIQSNKTRVIAENFNWVHSVDTRKVAKRLNDQRPKNFPPLNVLIQINISGEVSKSGVTTDNAKKLASEIVELPNLNLQGLMTLPKATTEFAKQRIPFRNLRELRDNIGAALGIQLPHLSMGMTGDFAAAIIEGSTWIRIGSAIFGPR